MAKTGPVSVVICEKFPFPWLSECLVTVLVFFLLITITLCHSLLYCLHCPLEVGGVRLEAFCLGADKNECAVH